jgi:D-serine deaminase-like pyridoxal phosphate-dependent protein
VRMLPNHACSKAAQYEHYRVLSPGREIVAT